MTKNEFNTLNERLKHTPLVKRTKEKLTTIWYSKNKVNGNKYGDEFKYLFGLRLYQYALGKKFDYETTILPEDIESRSKIIESYRKRKRKGKTLSSLTKQFQRLSIGYNSLSYELTPKRCNLSSEEANKKVSNKKNTNDHVIGATLCAQFVIEVFLEGKISDKETWTNLEWINKRIEYMCNEWLKDNLWLWATCRITRDEHNPSKEKGKGGLKRSYKNVVEEIEYRANFEHYDKANIYIEDYK